MNCAFFSQDFPLALVTLNKMQVNAKITLIQRFTFASGGLFNDAQQTCGLRETFLLCLRLIFIGQEPLLDSSGHTIINWRSVITRVSAANVWKMFSFWFIGDDDAKLRSFVHDVAQWVVSFICQELIRWFLDVHDVRQPACQSWATRVTHRQCVSLKTNTVTENMLMVSRFKHACWYDVSTHTRQTGN